MSIFSFNLIDFFYWFQRLSDDSNQICFGTSGITMEECLWRGWAIPSYIWHVYIIDFTQIEFEYFSRVIKFTLYNICWLVQYCFFSSDVYFVMVMIHNVRNSIITQHVLEKRKFLSAKTERTQIKTEEIDVRKK